MPEPIEPPAAYENGHAPSLSEQPRYSFLDDYSEGAHPQLLKALLASNASQQGGYGSDSYSALARQHIRAHLGRPDAGVFFVPSGTAANAISIAACLRPHEAVIAASSGHIATREAGAIEATGHKIITVPPPPGGNGKLTPAAVQRALDDNWHAPHMAPPRLVYLSNATEVGTVYTRTELAAIKALCEAAGLLLLVDGARLGCALASPASDLTLRDMAELADVFWIGGTKNGALLGEAVVVKDAALARDFECYVKRHGALLAKSRVMGAQFCELFAGGGSGSSSSGDGHGSNGSNSSGGALYFDLARQANAAAARLSEGIAAAGFMTYAATQTNQVFAVLPMWLIERLKREFVFYVWEKMGDEEAVVRLLTTWATDEAQVNKFIHLVQAGAEMQ